MPIVQHRPTVLLLLFVPTEPFAAPTHVLRKAWKSVPPSGMLLVFPFQLPNFPTVFVRMLIASVSESRLESKSPIFHSPNATVLLVPSVTSREPRAPSGPGLWVAKTPVMVAFDVQGQHPGPIDPQ